MKEYIILKDSVSEYAPDIEPISYLTGNDADPSTSTTLGMNNLKFGENIGINWKIEYWFYSGTIVGYYYGIHKNF